MLLVHVLSMASVNHGNGIALDGIGIIPFAGVGHVIPPPSADSWFTARKCALDGIDVEDGVADVALHVFERVCMAVF